MKAVELWDLSHTMAKELLEKAENPWEILGEISDYILYLGEKLDPSEYEQISKTVWVAKDAKITASAQLNGPLIIGHETEIRQCAFIRGSALVGQGAVVGNSTELKNCILFDKVQVPHFNYVGDSILGYMSHMGAGAVTSNVRSDKKTVIVHIGDQKLDTGLPKFGALLGDLAEVGCNSVLNPGTILGRESIVYPTSCVRCMVPHRCIHKNNGTIIPRCMDEE